MKDEIINYGSTALSWFLMAIQIDEVLRYINLGLSIFLTLLSIGVSTYNIFKSAKEKGKIDRDEVNNVVDKVNDLKDQLNGLEKENEDESKRED